MIFCLITSCRTSLDYLLACLLTGFLTYFVQTACS